MHPQETRIYFTIIIAICVLSILLALCIVVITKYHNRKNMLHLNRVKADINFLEKERARIAADLHDDFGASLSAIKLKLQCIEPDNVNESRLIEEAELYIDEAMKKLRRISFTFMPSILQTKGLNEAVYELVDTVTLFGKIKVNYYCDAIIHDKEKRVHIYRIIQEVINNVIKHSKATSFIVKILSDANNTTLNLRDNGVGFDKNLVVKRKEGLGLQNIVSRCELLGARLYLTTSPGQGVDYIIEIPK